MKIQDAVSALLGWYNARAVEGKGRIQPFQYRDAGAAIGISNWETHAQFFGQVQSGVDYACYRCDLPPLSLTAAVPFRNAWTLDASFDWAFPVETMTSAARNHTWTSEEFAELIAATSTVGGSPRIKWKTELELNAPQVRRWAEQLGSLSIVPATSVPRAYWWVNQNQTYRDETLGGFLWSPKTRADGAANKFYENMVDVRPGDVIFSFCDTKIKAIGVATGTAHAAPKPFDTSGAYWADEGWQVPVEFRELPHPIRPKDHIELLREHLPPKYSPLQRTGDGLQSVYLAEVPLALADVLISLLGTQYTTAYARLTAVTGDLTRNDEQIEKAIEGRTDIGPTEKASLVMARRGQGIFKLNVAKNERGCRVTGITDHGHLRASHIKPWGHRVMLRS